MLTPAESSKRLLADADSAVPTRKAARHEEHEASPEGSHSSSQAFDMHWGMLMGSVRAIADLDALDFTAEQLLFLLQARERLSAVIGRVETARNTPEEQLLPTDHLVHVLSFLPSKDLRAAGLTCCHIDAAVQSAAKSRLEAMFGRAYPRHHHSFNLPCLLRMEAQMADVGRLVRRLKKSMKDSKHECSEAAGNIIDQLKECDDLVLGAL